MSLDVGGQVLLLLLDRVRAGAITEFCGQYFDEGRRVSWHTVEVGFECLLEVGCLELIYPPDSGVWRAREYRPGELVKGVHCGLTEAELTRRAVLTERGLAQHQELRERQRVGTTMGAR